MPTKSDLESVVERINDRFEGEYVLNSRGSNPTVYDVSEVDPEGGEKPVFKPGEVNEIYYLAHGMIEADRRSEDTERPMGERVGCLCCGFSYDGTEHDDCPVCEGGECPICGGED